MSGRGEYRAIYSVLPESPEFQALSTDARLLLYTIKLTLGPSGIGVLYDGQLADRSGLTVSEVDAARDELVEHDWLRVERRLHWLRNGLRFEPSLTVRNEKHRTSIERFLRGLPKLEIVNDFAGYYDLDLPFPDLESRPLPDTHSDTPSHTHDHTPKDGNGNHRIPNSEYREASTENRRPNTDGGGIAELLGYLPERDGVENSVRAIAATSNGSPDTWAIGFLGMYGPSGTRHRELSQLPEGERPAVLLDALQAYLAEGQPWDQRFFSGFVRNAAKRHLGGESPDFGDETRRDHRRRETYRRREGAAGRKKAQEDIERQQAELEELRDWYDDLPPEDQQQIDDDAEARVKVMATGTRGRVPKAMKQAAFLAAVKEARESMQPTTEEKNP